MTTTTALLEVDQLTKVIQHKVLLDQITFAVGPGEICALIGHNGAGKSLLLRCILHHETIDGGRVTVNRIPHTDRTYLREATGFVSSDHLEFLDPLTPREYFDFLIAIYQVPDDYASGLVLLMTKQLQIEPFMDTLVQNLSFGTKKKVQLLAVLLYRPKLLVCDEIFEGLDAESVEVVKEIFRNYAAQGNSILYTTHLHEIAEEISGSRYRIATGRLGEVVR